ncbi:haloacid dehalogenase-like hydrolase [Streptococcus macacae NCTC 11558]|nr:haloacid dehalogenase-like hydrolase [Streptococcus macacae NCTC 11558]
MIAIDLDGTLLKSDGTISDYSIAIIKKIQKQGHFIIITTGRPYRMAVEYYKILGLKTPMINFNGSLTHIPEKKWAGEQRARIDRKYLFEVLKNEKAFEADFIASEYRKKFYLTLNNPQTIKPEIFGVKKFTDQMLLKPEKITRDPHALLMQTRAADKYALADDMRLYFKNEMEIGSWGGPMNILEFSPKGVHKAYALKNLLKTLNLSQENLIAFGDEHNDTQMLAFACVGYAMKNASKVLLPYADKMTQFDNDHDGVAKELEKIFL